MLCRNKNHPWHGIAPQKHEKSCQKQFRFFKTIHQNFRETIIQLETNQKNRHFHRKLSKNHPLFEKTTTYRPSSIQPPSIYQKNNPLKSGHLSKSVQKVSNFCFTPVQFCPIKVDTSLAHRHPTQTKHIAFGS